KASTVTARATVYHTVSRRRMVVISCLHHVPDATHRVYQLLGLPRIDLLAQPIDHHVHDVGAGIKVVIPGILSDRRTGHDLAGVPHEVLEDGVLLGGELDPLARPADLARGHIELEVA